MLLREHKDEEKAMISSWFETISSILMLLTVCKQYRNDEASTNYTLMASFVRIL